MSHTLHPCELFNTFHSDRSLLSSTPMTMALTHILLMLSMIYAAVLPWPILLLRAKLSLTATALLELTAHA